jgi:hypothetical protein
LDFLKLVPGNAYRIAPIFLIRMAGVPFEVVERLATIDTARKAREVLVRQTEFDQAKDRAERFLAHRDNGLPPKAFRALRAAVRENRVPPAVEGAELDVFRTFAKGASEMSEAMGKLRETIERELAASRVALMRGAREFLAPYLVFGSGEVHSLLGELSAPEVESLAPRNSKISQRERPLLLYLQRIAAKNDTFSAFGPSSWGTIETQNAGVSFSPEPGPMRREVFLERWTAHAAAAAMNADPEVREEIKVPALQPHAFELLVAEVSRWPESDARDRWLAALSPLVERAREFVSATTTARRLQLMDQARELLDQFGAARKSTGRSLYSATNPLGEECSRVTDFVISETMTNEFTNDAEPWIDLWRDSYAFVAGRVAAGLRKLLESAPIKNGSVMLPEFLAHCEAQKMPLTGHGLVVLAHLAFQEVKAAFRAQFADRADASEWKLTMEDCRFVRKNFEYAKFDEYTFPSADLQLSAASIEATARGEYEWILGELHPPIALMHHCFYWSCPDPAALSQALASTVFGGPNFHFGFAPADFTAHTTVRLFDALPDHANFVAPQKGDPAWRTTAPADAEVFVDEQNGDVGLRRRDSGEYLGSFARGWLIPLGFHPFHFSLPGHTPRLRCGRVIVQRECWTVSLDEFGDGDFTGISTDLVLAMEKLRAAKNWPRFIYIRPTEQALRRSGAEGRDKDTKPVFIDLESYLFLEIFHRWLVKAGELDVTEMLPDPDHLLWQETNGRRTFELRTQIVPR